MNREEDRLHSMLADLHDEAIRTITDGRLAWYKEVNQTYREVVLAFPREAKRLGDLRWGQSTDVFFTGPIERIERALYEEMRQAIEGRNREIGFEAVAAPRRISEDALDIGATDLSVRMLRLTIIGYRIGRARGTELGRLVASHAALLAIEFIDFSVIGRLTRELEHDGDQREAYAEHARQSFVELADLCRFAVESGDTEEFEGLLERWESMIQDWPSKYPWSDAGTADRLASGGGQNAKRALSEIRNELEIRYRVHLVQLLHWTLRSAGPSEQRDQRRFVDLAGQRFRGLTDLCLAFDDALKAQWGKGGTVLDRWIWEAERRAYGARVSSPDEGLLRSFVILALWKLEPDETHLPPLRWMRLHAPELVSMIRSLTGVEDDLRALALSDLDERRDRLADLIEKAARAQLAREKESLRRAPLAADLVRQYSQLVADAWRRNLLLPTILASGGRRAHGAEPNPSEIVEEEWLPKEFFVSPVTLGGMSSTASRLGTRLGRRELRMLLEQVELIVGLPAAPSLKEGVERSLAQFDADPEGLVLLVPRMWQLNAVLGLSLDGREAPPEWGLQPEQAHVFAGFVAGVPTFRVAEVPDYQFVILRAGALEVTYLLDSTVEGPLVSVHSIDEKSALDLAAVRSASHEEDIQSRALQVQERVRVRVARWVRIPGPVQGKRFLFWIP